MVVLAIESATATAAVALADGDGVLATFSAERGRRHVETLAPAVSLVCRSAGVALGDVSAVAVDVGPGLFTGLRVGMGTAQALGFALGVPLCPATSLEVLARGVATSGLVPGTTVVAVVDARRGEVFAAWFGVTDGAGSAAAVEQRGEDAVLSPDALANLLTLTTSTAPAAPVVVVGDGARRYAAILGGVPGVRVAGPQWDAPPVSVLALLGVARLAAGAVVAPASLVPRYLRAADTRINWHTRAARSVPAAGA